MWSDTGLTLTEFALMMHIDPYRLAQVNRTGGNTVECDCYYQNVDRHVGRAEIVRAIQFAETQFVTRAQFYPVPTAIVGERQEYPKSKREAYKLFTPQYGMVQRFGKLVWEEIGTVSLTRQKAGAIQDIFSATFPVPDGTEAEQLHVYITSADSGALLPDRAWEVRPLTRLTVDRSGGSGAWMATIQGPAYLFVRPEHYMTANCLPHDFSTYVEQVSVWRATVDACEQGRFVFRPNCDQPPCGEQYADVCFEKVGHGQVRPQFATCVDGVFQATNRCSVSAWPPTHIEMNYIAGAPLERGMMDSTWAEAVFGFTLANMDAGLELCPCDKVSTTKLEQYRSVPKTEISTGLAGPSSRQFSLLVDRDDLRRLKGLQPVYGNLLAMGIIKSHSPRVSAGVM